MEKIFRMPRVLRRQLVRAGRRTADLDTAVRFHIIARLGLGESSPQVAKALEVYLLAGPHP